MPSVKTELQAPLSQPEYALPAVSLRYAFLTQEHADLDGAIAALEAAGHCDALLISRLKKRKLQIKDELAALSPVSAAA